MFARTTSLALALTLTLPAAGSQKYSLSSQQAASRSGLGEAGTQGANAVNLSAIGVSAGSWNDPSLSRVGSMSGQLVDGLGELRFDVHAVLSETAVAGFQPRKRYGSLSGFLAAPGQRPASVENPQILASGSWRLETYRNVGDFTATLYMQGPTPMAPLLVLGSMDGKLRRPRAQPKGGSVQASAGPSGAGSNKFSLSSQKSANRSALEEDDRDRAQSASKQLVQRPFVGRWDMPSM